MKFYTETEKAKIKELAKKLCHVTNCPSASHCPSLSCKAVSYATRVYDLGFRHPSEVVEELKKYILEGATTIESDNSDAMYGAKFALETVVLPILEAYGKGFGRKEGRPDDT